MAVHVAYTIGARLRWCGVIRLTALLVLLVATAAPQAQEGSANGTQIWERDEASGPEIYRAACAACHGDSGTGRPRAVVGFDQPLPDFTDCRFTTPEPSADWAAVVHEGGRIRGLDRHMPAFGSALSSQAIEKVVSYVAGFCADQAWPRGELNFPRALFTEKAYPENEAVFTYTGTTSGPGAIAAAAVYERRFGKRNQLEISLPVQAQEDPRHLWTGGLGDLAVAAKRTVHANTRAGRIVSLSGEVVVPTAHGTLGLDTLVVEPAVLVGQAIGAASFIQGHAGVEVPLDRAKASLEPYARLAFGASFAQNHGFGRVWTPMVETLWAHPEGEASEVDVVPQMQVSLSKLQHVMVSGGVRLPVTGREERHPQVSFYLLWDWFDGGFFEFWR